MPDIHITDHGIAKLLPNLDPSKAAGPDELKPKIFVIFFGISSINSKSCVSHDLFFRKPC
jgi:hypothetical protein